MSKFKRKIIPYQPYLKQLARNLRNNSTASEIILWKYLQGKQMKGYDFHRQKPLDNYFVDFYCNELMLAVEIDGNSHDNENTSDTNCKYKIAQSYFIFIQWLMPIDNIFSTNKRSTVWTKIYC